MGRIDNGLLYTLCRYLKCNKLSVMILIFKRKNVLHSRFSFKDYTFVMLVKQICCIPYKFVLSNNFRNYVIYWQLTFGSFGWYNCVKQTTVCVLNKQLFDCLSA